jgi:type IV fimbrial biogenesis protein FimT
MRVPSQPRNVPAIGTPCRAQGFTIVELMITVAVAAILLVIAVPSFNNIINSNRLTTAANAMVNSLNTARMEAIKLNATTQWCSSAPYQNTDSTGSTADSALSAACGTSAGAVVELTGSTANSLLAAPQLTSPVQLSGYNLGIRFNGQGVGYWAEDPTKTPLTSTIAVLCVAGLSGNNVITISMATGTIVTTTPSPSTETCR